MNYETIIKELQKIKILKKSGTRIKVKEMKDYDMIIWNTRNGRDIFKIKKGLLESYLLLRLSKYKAFINQDKDYEISLEDLADISKVSNLITLAAMEMYYKGERNAEDN